MTTNKTINAVFLLHKVNRASSCKVGHLIHRLFCSIGQTSHEASSTMRSLINTILEREPGVIHAGGAKKIMVSTGTMPMTPIKMLSSATMPRTPNQMTSIGTMPKTPTIVSTGTMPKTPTRPATTTSFSVSDNEPIVLSSPTPSIIDLVSPTVETIDLCSQSTPTNTDSPRPATN